MQLSCAVVYCGGMVGMMWYCWMWSDVSGPPGWGCGDVVVLLDAE